ncbi:MAG: hypothetical protein IRY94_07180 [Rhodospirillaceae bacterium]|nr:hypothetical protein [Rhodospirillaceae bacterium]
MQGRALAGLAHAALFAAALAAAGLAIAATAQAAPRFASPHITPEDWQRFYDEVRSKPDARDISRPDVTGVIAISVPSERTVYYFTKPGPVHPAVIIEEIVVRDGRLTLRYSGYYAGSEAAFAQWFDSFRRRSQGVRDVLQPPAVGCANPEAVPCP